MSYLTQPIGVLEQAVIDGLAGEGFTFNPGTEDFSQFLSRALGQPAAYLRKYDPQLLVELQAAFGGSGADRSRMGYAQLLDLLVAQLSGAGGGGGGDNDPKAWVDADATPWVTADGTQWVTA